ncbi:MAG: transcriptional repressor [Bacteroidales bacterium]|nr:transcriptional repressor [Candidatus Colimorpha onthohippi]
MQDAHEYLIAHNIHPSQQRVAVMRYLLDHHIHPTADDIYTALAPQMPTLSKTTIYNTLKVFADAGAIQVITIDEEATRYDATLLPHAHFKCQKCGLVYDIDFPANIDPTARQPEIPKDFELTSVQIYYQGICAKCKRNQN